MLNYSKVLDAYPQQRKPQPHHPMRMQRRRQQMKRRTLQASSTEP